MKTVDLDDLFDVLALPQTRDEALARGHKRYFTGKPCRKGHVAARIVSDECCVECALERARRYRERKFPDVESRAERSAKVRAKRASDPELRAREAERKRIAWKEGRRREDPEKVNARSRAYKQRNPEKQKEAAERKRAEGRTAEAGRRYRQNNPDKSKATDICMRAKRASAAGEFTSDDLKRIRERQNDCCAACDLLLWGKGHVDHIKPIAKGGANWASNIQLLCPTCNMRKSDKDWHSFLTELYWR